MNTVAAVPTLVTCHANADFDAFAAMIAARRLYPGCCLLFPGTQDRGLQAIVQDEALRKKYNFVELTDIDFAAIGRLVAVDTRQRERLSHVAPLLDREDMQVEVWDHHPDTPNDIRCTASYMEIVGSVTALLVLRLKEENIALEADEIFVSDGAKSDVANFQELFDVSCKVALQDPVYPVYLDTNVMAGRTGNFENGRFGGIVYLPCTEESGFIPDLPRERVDLVYLCSPNNPTGAAMTRSELKKWVDWATQHNSVILYDSAYEAFITQPDVPHSIYEIPGAQKVAVEFRSFSKTAGFTGTRCAYTVVPKALQVYDRAGKPHALNALWLRRQTTKFNGVPYIVQRAAQAVFTPMGQAQIRSVIEVYQKNAQVILQALQAAGLQAFGGVNAPYIWLKTPNGIDSWTFFDRLLSKARVVGTPGVGFGACGEGYFRLTAFNTPELTQAAASRIAHLTF